MKRLSVIALAMLFLSIEASSAQTAPPMPAPPAQPVQPATPVPVPVETAKQVAPATPLPTPAAVLDPSLAHELEAAIGSSLDWLAACQRADGSWSDTNYPALTAMPLWAFAQSNHPRKAEVCEKAVKFLLGFVQEDGGIYVKVKDRKGGGLGNYNTAISMTALHATGRPDLIPVIQKAREYVAAGQHLGDDQYRGGFGYDWATDRAYADLMNTAWATEAMRLTQDVEGMRTGATKRADIDWEATAKFLERLQKSAEAGGFPYRPDESKAGEYTNEAGKVVLRSYGSMTYSGMLSMIYCRVSRDDPRVKSAFDWARNHWSLDENPGMGPQGLYRFYHIITKSLAAYGEDNFKIQTGANVKWRTQVVERMLSLKKTDPQGRVFWLNESGRFMESDPVLSTAYTLLALQIASGL